MRILIISYYFPPYMNVGGLRALSWARVFHDVGHDITVVHGDGQEANSCAYFPESLGRDLRVLKVHNPRLGAAVIGGARAVESRTGSGRASLIARLTGGGKGAIKTLVPVVDLFGPWARSARKVIDAEIAQRGPFDAILSTSFPLSAHKVAQGLHRSQGGTWVADFRDFFGQFESTRLGGLAPRTWRIKAFVRTVGREAEHVATVSGELQALLGKVLPGIDIGLYFNGYFEEHLPSPRPQTTVWRILYTGSYNAKEFTIAPLVEALVSLRDGGIEPPILSFVGGRIESLVGQLDAAGLAYEFLPGMPNREILRLQAESALLLLCDAMSGPGVLLTKTFEYLAARRPVIVITRPGSELATTLFSRPSPSYLLSQDPGEIAAFVRKRLAPADASEDFMDPAEVRGYSREVQAESLLKRILEIREGRA